MASALNALPRIAIAGLLCIAGILATPAFGQEGKTKPDTGASTPKGQAGSNWHPLFTGKDLSGWKVTNFGGEGEVTVQDDHVAIAQGVDLSGITSTRKDLPAINYEIEFEAQRVLGSDFFIGLTFPVNDASCSLICGGWGGGVCGLSSLDGMDASENETTSYTAFTNGQWHTVRLRVTTAKIEAWLDKSQIVDVETEGRRIDVRFEIDPARPLGFSTFQSTAWIRKARIRRIKAQNANAQRQVQEDTNTGTE